MPARFVQTLLYMLGGLLVWGTRFLGTYSFTAIACAKGWAEDSAGGSSLIILVVGSASLLAAAGCGVLLGNAALQLRRQRTGPRIADDRRFVHWVAALVAGLAIVAIVWETLPLLFVPACV